MAKKPLTAVTPSSGNVFLDIRVPEPDEELAKAQLASRIREIVRRSRLTQAAAAAVMGIDQPKVSALLSGRLAKFSSERLMRLLSRLGQDVEIVVKSTPRRRQRGRIRVVQEAVTAALKQVVTEKDRSALARRLKRGRVVYQSDPPGSRFTERIEPDGTRTLGRLMNRRFVPARSAGSRARGSTR